MQGGPLPERDVQLHEKTRQIAAYVQRLEDAQTTTRALTQQVDSLKSSTLKDKSASLC